MATTLVAGGGSRIGSQVAQLLKGAGRDVFFGSRSGRVPSGFAWVKLDWNDSSTFVNPFKCGQGQGANTPALGRNITSLYLVGPMTDLHHGQKIIPFIELAISNGVKRIVYVSATIADRHNNSGGMGEIPGYLEDLVKGGKGIDYLVLRPTWFIDNLELEYQTEIRDHGRISSIVPNGKTPYVASADIAKVAFDGIVCDDVLKKYGRRDPFILGPELLSWDEVANILTQILSRPVTHIPVGIDEMRKFYSDLYRDMGPTDSSVEEIVDWIIFLDEGVEAGSEERTFERRNKEAGFVIGKTTVVQWVVENKKLWELK